MRSEVLEVIRDVKRRKLLRITTKPGLQIGEAASQVSLECAQIGQERKWWERKKKGAFCVEDKTNTISKKESRVE
jgi:hypothetical protein